MSDVVCEVCGKELRRLQVHACPKRRGEPFGVLLELRGHTFGIERHEWWQEHNCVRLEPDRCYVRCGDDPPRAMPIPDCCVAYRQAAEAEADAGE